MVVACNHIPGTGSPCGLEQKEADAWLDQPIDARDDAPFGTTYEELDRKPYPCVLRPREKPGGTFSWQRNRR
jgi:hypothetical protein